MTYGHAAKLAEALAVAGTRERYGLALAARNAAWKESAAARTCPTCKAEGSRPCRGPYGAVEGFHGDRLGPLPPWEDFLDPA